jgi:O-antigen ligase
MLLNSGKVRQRWIPYIFYILSGYAFGMTVSRSALLGLVIFIAFMYAFRKMERRRMLIFILVFLSAQALTPQTQYRITKLFQKEDIEGEISIGRPVIWRAALKAFEMKPLTGIGISLFFNESLRYIDEVMEEQYREDMSTRNKTALEYWKKWRYGVNPHNIFLTMLTEVGLAGLTAFLVVMIIYIKRLIKLKRYNSLILTSVILLISCFANYAPYYKYYLLICIVLYIGAKQDMSLTDEIELNKI